MTHYTSNVTIAVLTDKRICARNGSAIATTILCTFLFIEHRSMTRLPDTYYYDNNNVSY